MLARHKRLKREEFRALLRDLRATQNNANTTLEDLDLMFAQLRLVFENCSKDESKAESWIMVRTNDHIMFYDMAKDAWLLEPQGPTNYYSASQLCVSRGQQNWTLAVSDLEFLPRELELRHGLSVKDPRDLELVETTLGAFVFRRCDSTYAKLNNLVYVWEWSKSVVFQGYVYHISELDSVVLCAPLVDDEEPKAHGTLAAPLLDDYQHVLLLLDHLLVVLQPGQSQFCDLDAEKPVWEVMTPPSVEGHTFGACVVSDDERRQLCES